MPPRVASTSFLPDYALDPAVRQQLQLKTFEVCQILLWTWLPFLSDLLVSLQGKFEVKDLVGSVSEKLISQSKAEPGRACLVCLLNRRSHRFQSHSI